MIIKPLELADFDIVELRQTPHCKKHGAMNKVTKDGVWRCITICGYKKVNVGNSEGKIHKENICRAGCKQIS